MQNGAESKPEKDTVTLDIIEKCIGILGRWQICIFILLSLVKFPVTWLQLGIVFLAAPVDFRCEDNTIDKCDTNCTKHVYDTSTFTETIVTEWDLVCERQYLSSLAQTITMSGVLCGSMFFGYLADRFGRRNPLVISIILQTASGLAAAFSPWLTMFLVMRFLGGAAAGGEMITSFVMVMEIVGTKWRTTAGILHQIPLSIGHLIMPIFSYFLRDWRYFQAAISAPSVAFIVYYWILPESPRWQLATGDKQKAINTLKKAATYNKLSTVSIENHISVYMQKNYSENFHQKKGNIVDLVRTPVMRSYSFIICFSWAICGLCFFGISQFMGQLGGNIFINVALSAIIQIPSILFSWYTMNAWGRKLSLIVGEIISGVTLLIIACIPDNPVWVKSALAMAGMFGVTLAFPRAYIYSGELFPTVLRNVGVGACSASARVGSMIAPFVVDLGLVQLWIPPVIFGVLSLMGACMCVKLPETLNCKLPDTVAEVEELDKVRRKGNNNTEAKENVTHVNNS